MLDSKDLELLKAMMQEIVGESETRMTAKIESSIAESEARMTARIVESEARMTAKIADSEARTTAKIAESEARMTTEITDSEARTTAKIAESEARMVAKIEARVDDTRSMLMAYLESAIEPKIRGVAEGYETLRDSKASNSRMERLENEVITLRSLLMTMSAKMSKLEKAQ